MGQAARVSLSLVRLTSRRLIGTGVCPHIPAVSAVLVPFAPRGVKSGGTASTARMAHAIIGIACGLVSAASCLAYGPKSKITEGASAGLARRITRAFRS